MADEIAEWVARFEAAKLERIRAGNQLTRDLLQKSRKQLALSEKVLKLPVPKVWHPEPPSEAWWTGRRTTMGN
jgi:hypothetical protein